MTQRWSAAKEFRLGRLRWILAVGILVGSSALAGVAHAAVVGCGQAITQSTVLAADVGSCPGPGLVIGASDITLDLGGHSVVGAPSANSPGILLAAPNLRVRITNGTVTGFQTGVLVDRSVDSTNLIAGNAGDGVFPGHRVQQQPRNNTVRQNSIAVNGRDGIADLGFFNTFLDLGPAAPTPLDYVRPVPVGRPRRSGATART